MTAEEAGLRIGDRIVRVGEQTVTMASEFLPAAKQSVHDGILELEVTRGSRTHYIVLNVPTGGHGDGGSAP